MPASGANNGPQGRIQPKRAIKYNMATYTRVPVSMRTWHSYTTHPHENGRSSSAVSYVILRDNRNETFGRLVLKRRPGAVVVRLGRVQVARGHDARRGRQHVVSPRRVDADRAGEPREAVAEAGLRRPREEVRVRRGARVRVFCSNPREGSQHAREVLSLAAAVECEAVRVTACVEIKILRRVRAESSRRPPRHRRDACSMAWRCRFLAAQPSQNGRVIAEKGLSEELSGAPDTLMISTQVAAR